MDKKQLITEVVQGTAKMHRLDKEIGSQAAIRLRQEVVRELTPSSIETITEFSMDYSQASKKNCENMIGATQIPLGIAGPLKIDGTYSKGEYFFPLATTEGCLVAAVNRGCRASMLSGGVTAHIESKGITRAPVFRTKNLKESRDFVRWIKDNVSLIKEYVEKTDPHITFKGIQTWMAGRNVFTRFIFDTADAMGMNMAVVACDNVIKNLIAKETTARCVSVSGNMCSDKKPTALTFILGRGMSVWAEIFLKKEDVKSVLKVDPKDIVEVNNDKNHLGSELAGSYGFNAHFANIVAALFIATGQDPAHVVEGSMGVTTAEVTDDGDLYFSIYLPSLIIGAVGGGTMLDTQREALEIIGIDVKKGTPGDNVKKLAEVMAAAILAGELSLLSALASQDLARAHVVYGRAQEYKI
ncbi:hydroxymethylglutaryl-CoA reductase (NADPH) [Patescibacteria group bacterium]|nr:hydroxymethylglutaryl-CoA reductase (NADPH) [Patescibacteria group bacterium]